MPALTRYAALSCLGALLAGCTFATPFKTLDADDGRAARVLVITHAMAHSGQRELFMAHTRRVIDSLAHQPGLIGYSLRRELFGDELWTLTVWRDDDARATFFRSPVHVEAMAAGMSALRAARFLRVEWPGGSERPQWPELLARLVREGRSYAPRADAAPTPQ